MERATRRIPHMERVARDTIYGACNTTDITYGAGKRRIPDME